VRLEFVCGARAVRRARADFEALSRIAHSLSASLDGAPDVVTSQTAQLGDAIGERKRLRKALADARARSLADAATPNEAGVCWLVLRGGGGLALEELRDLASAVAALPRAALIASCEHPPTVIVAAAAGSGVDAGRLLREALAAAGGRGGGSATLAQGSAPSPSAASAVVDSLATIVGATRSS
jgi:alanyl-tRNA synthetase